MLNRTQKLAIYMEGHVTGDAGKMGLGVLRYSPNPIVCVIDSSRAGEDLRSLTGIDRACPIVATVAEATALGAEVFVLGIAPPGGLIPPDWFPVIDEAWAAGMSLVNGLHDLLGPRFSGSSRLPRDVAQPSQWVWDIRVEPEGLMPGLGRAAKLPNRRLLLIGTDMAVGKMTAGLELHRAARARGVKAEFLATGQIGITITGQGVPLDAVRVDYASGAIEREVLRHREAELIIVEGQGSLIHPGSTATLPLMRGSCPTDLVLCVRAGQTGLARLPEIQIPPLGDFIRLYERLAAACGTFPAPRTVGVCMNTARLSDSDADSAKQALEAELGLPVVDPVRDGELGCQRLLDALALSA